MLVNELQPDEENIRHSPLLLTQSQSESFGIYVRDVVGDLVRSKQGPSNGEVVIPYSRFLELEQLHEVLNRYEIYDSVDIPIFNEGFGLVIANDQDDHSKLCLELLPCQSWPSNMLRVVSKTLTDFLTDAYPYITSPRATVKIKPIESSPELTGIFVGDLDLEIARFPSRHFTNSQMSFTINIRQKPLPGR